MEHGTLEDGRVAHVQVDRTTPPQLAGLGSAGYGLLATNSERDSRVSSGCRHSGPCEAEFCSCSRRNVFCSQLCSCQTCRNVRQGCLCHNCKDDCPCRNAGFECEPGLCKSCGVDVVLDPANRGDLDIGKKRCQNCALQLDRPYRTFVGESSVHGWGLYAGEDIPRGGFLGRYRGEAISKKEAERREMLYEAIDRRYVFSVDEEHDIDAYSAGNKMRFMNEPSGQGSVNAAFTTLSCHSGMRLVGVVATCDISRGQEIFVDYGSQ
jgi:hypothetical protein